MLSPESMTFFQGILVNPRLLCSSIDNSERSCVQSGVSKWILLVTLIRKIAEPANNLYACFNYTFHSASLPQLKAPALPTRQANSRKRKRLAAFEPFVSHIPGLKMNRIESCHDSKGGSHASTPPVEGLLLHSIPWAKFPRWPTLMTPALPRYGVRQPGLQ